MSTLEKSITVFCTAVGRPNSTISRSRRQWNPILRNEMRMDQGDVQHHVDDGAGDEVIEGMGGVAAGLQDAHENVVHDQARTAGEVDLQIQGCVGEHVLRRAHGPQDHRREQDPQRREQRAEEQPHGRAITMPAPMEKPVKVPTAK